MISVRQTVDIPCSVDAGRKQREVAMVNDPENGANEDDGATSTKTGSSPLATTPTSRPPSLDFSSKRSSVEVQPLSPTGYQQPPTPDHPPPSPMTAVLGIHEKINPKVGVLVCMCVCVCVCVCVCLAMYERVLARGSQSLDDSLGMG